MSEVFFNTNEVARMLQVDKSTVKRWSDEGKLKCYRTPGGHRKFSVECLYQFMNEYDYSFASNKLTPFMSSDDAMLKQVINRNEFHILQSVVVDSALKLNKEEIIKVVTEAYQNGLSLSLILDNIIKPSSKRIFDLMNNGRLAAYDFVLANNELSSALVILSHMLPRETYREQEIVCLSLCDEHNSVEYAATTTLLEHLGYKVLNLGNKASSEKVNTIFDAKKVPMVCLYCNSTAQWDSLMTNVSMLRNVLIGKNVFLILTGETLIGKFQNFFAGISFRVCSSFSEIELINVTTTTK